VASELVCGSSCIVFRVTGAAIFVLVEANEDSSKEARISPWPEGNAPGLWSSGFAYGGISPGVVLSGGAPRLERDLVPCFICGKVG